MEYWLGWEGNRRGPTRGGTKRTRNRIFFYLHQKLADWMCPIEPDWLALKISFLVPDISPCGIADVAHVERIYS